MKKNIALNGLIVLMLLTILSGCQKPANLSTNTNNTDKSSSAIQVKVTDDNNSKTETKPTESKETANKSNNEDNNSLNLKSNEKVISSKTKSTEIEVVYPIFNNESVDTKLKNALDLQVATFKDAVEDPLPQDAGFTNYYKASYTLTKLTDKIISIRFDISSYAGGAHPDFYYVTKSYNLDTGKEIQLSDLFKQNSAYLKTLSELSLKKLVKNFDYLKDIKEKDLATSGETEWIRTGTEPKDENFKNWALEGQNLVLYFSPYQVASWAEGPQKIEISLSELKNFLAEPFLSEIK